MPGAFWPGDPASDLKKLFEIRLIDADDKYKVSPN
jgi:hypothetical protein